MNLVNEVIFPFRTHLACFFRALLTLAGDKVLKRDSLRTNEALLKVGVDLTGRVRRSRTDRDNSRVHFFHARGEVGLQAEQLIARADHAVQPRSAMNSLWSPSMISAISDSTAA